MKQSDIISIILVATVGMMGAFFAANAILDDPNLATATYKEAVPIESTLVDPDPELFNGDAINPTVEVEIGVCEDTNGNGILDPEERKKCLGQETTDDGTAN